MALHKAVQDAMIPIVTPKTIKHFLNAPELRRRVRIGTRTETVSPLKVNMPHPMLALSATPELLKSGYYREDDYMDHFVQVETIVFNFTFGKNNTPSFVACGVGRIPSSHFLSFATLAERRGMDVKQFTSDLNANWQVAMDELEPDDGVVTPKTVDELVDETTYLGLALDFGELPPMSLTVNGMSYKVEIAGDLCAAVNMKTGLLHRTWVTQPLKVRRVHPMPNPDDMVEITRLFDTGTIEGWEVAAWRRNPRRFYNL